MKTVAKIDEKFRGKCKVCWKFYKWVIIVLLFIVITLVLSSVHYFDLNNNQLITVTIAEFALLFSALSISYSKIQHDRSLFEERFKIFSQVNKVVWDVVSRQEVSDIHLETISGDLVHESYFIFCSRTYLTIKKIRKSLIKLSKLKDWPDIDGTKEFAYLNKLMEEETLARRFYELKLTSY